MNLNLVVLGNGTLAKTTATCCARHFQVTTTNQSGLTPDLVWMCEDVPLTKWGEDYDYIDAQIREALRVFPAPIPVLISSQMPVGTIARYELLYPKRHFAYSPENIRVAHAESDFMRQDRIVVGYRNSEVFDNLLYALFRPFTETLLMTNPETAEMCKHVLNAYLGMNIAFINEIKQICDAAGADIRGVEDALLRERRVSPLAPLHAGAPFGGGHLARDLHLLTTFSDIYGLANPLLKSILPSNSAG